MSSYLLIDTSYYNFYRYYATVQWYKNAHPDEDLDSINDWTINKIFMEKFEKMFLENIKKYKKKFNSNKIIFARDCPRENIWRMSFYPEYKQTREQLYNSPNKFKGGPVFKYCYDNIIPKLLNQDTIQIKIPNLEADDIIYLSTKNIIKRNSDNPSINIISSDHDLLQILDEKNNISLFTANLKCYNDKSKGNCEKNNFMKAILGDNSDNIKKIFDKIGPKTAEKLYEDQTKLLKKFEEIPGSLQKFCLNKLLVDFNYIPNEFEIYFNSKYYL